MQHFCRCKYLWIALPGLHVFCLIPSGHILLNFNIDKNICNPAVADQAMLRGIPVEVRGINCHLCLFPHQVVPQLALLSVRMPSLYGLPMVSFHCELFSCLACSQLPLLNCSNSIMSWITLLLTVHMYFIYFVLWATYKMHPKLEQQFIIYF